MEGLRRGQVRPHRTGDCLEGSRKNLEMTKIGIKGRRRDSPLTEQTRSRLGRREKSFEELTGGHPGKSHAFHSFSMYALHSYDGGTVLESGDTAMNRTDLRGVQQGTGNSYLLLRGKSQE